MRSQLKTLHTVVKVPTKIRYQFDDTITPEKPHVVEWRGISASGESEQKAIENLGVAIHYRAATSQEREDD